MGIHTGFDQVKRICCIIAIILKRILNALWHYNGGGKMDHRIGSEICDRLLKKCFIRQVSLDKIPIKHGTPVPRGEIIENEKIVSFFPQAFYNVTADIACTTGNKYPIIYHIS